MQTSGLPTRMPTPFADSGTKNTIPIPSQIGVTAGLASYTTGFPPLTMTPVVAGGVPPYGADFNGILNAITAAVRWSNAGGMYAYDSTFSTAVGGYPKGAILARSGFDGFWVSTTENNTTNPDAAGAGWSMLSPQGWDYVAGTGSANIYTATYVPAILALKDGLTLHSTAIAANTGASTFSPNGLTAKPILSLAQTALAGGELAVSGRFTVKYNITLDSWILMSSSGVVNQATETAYGVAKVATQALTNAGADDATIVTPKKMRAGFSILLGATGYITFPTWLGGLIIQWGTATVTATAGSTINWPLTFPTAILSAAVADGSSSCLSYGIGSKTTASAFVTCRNPASSGALTTGGCSYIVVGY